MNNKDKLLWLPAIDVTKYWDYQELGWWESEQENDTTDNQSDDKNEKD